MDLPRNLILEDLPGPKRGSHPTLYFRDEAVWSPRRTHFALAYTICEASMNNDVGCVLWARVEGDEAHVLQNPKGVFASCWRSPWCRWLSEEVFVFKAQKYDGKTTHVPLVAIHVSKGFQVLANTDTPEKWIDSASLTGERWTSIKARCLLGHV